MRYCSILRSILLAAVVLSTSFAGLAAPATQPASVDFRKPIPDGAAQKEAINRYYALFKDDLATANIPEAKAILAEKVIQTAMDTKDDRATQYVLLEKARELTIQSGDVEATLQTIETQGKIFAVDTVTLASNALVALATNSKADLGSKIAPFIDANIARDNYVLARKLAVAGNRTERIEEIRALEAEHAKVGAAVNTLSANPGDPAANFLMGRYCCLIKGDWSKGLPMLAKAVSVTPQMKTAIEGELAKPAEPEKQMAVGDSWLAISEKEIGVAKDRARQRAAKWYRMALPRLLPLAKARAEKRMQGLGLALTAEQESREMMLDVGRAGKMKLVLIPAGKFTMGRPSSERECAVGEWPQHPVRFSKPFYMGVYLVTRGQFAAFVSDTLYKTDAEKEGRAHVIRDAKRFLMRRSEALAMGAPPPRGWVQGASWRNPGISQTDDHPVVCVSHNDAVAFCEWLSKKTGNKVSLPTSAQWEYACRAGSTSRFGWGNDESKLGEYAWYVENSENQTHPVGQKKPNAWGLYDIQGNAWQWCQDWAYYTNENLNLHIKDRVDPTGPETGKFRILRGGGWDVSARGCYPFANFRERPNYPENTHGFRVVVEAPQSAAPAVVPAATPAESLAVPKAGEKEDFTIELGKGATLKFAKIPAGKFMMGSPNSEKDRRSHEGPQHEVTISKPFYMSLYDVTRGQFAAYVAETGYKTDAEKVVTPPGKKDAKKAKAVNVMSWKNLPFAQTDDHPVVFVSYNDAGAFCRWVSKKAGKSVHLPTEAQWEYACRAGTTTRFYYGDDEEYSQLGEYAWYIDNSGRTTHPVGQKKPNAWGLYDMHGNVWQWCQDWYASSYTGSKETDPLGPATGTARVLRGGCRTANALMCRSGHRINKEPDARAGDNGFRVVVDE